MTLSSITYTVVCLFLLCVPQVPSETREWAFLTERLFQLLLSFIGLQQYQLVMFV